MIFDDLSNASLYYGVHPGVEKALRYLLDTDLEQIAEGRYEIEGDSVFALVQQYASKPKEEGFWEAHRQYADVQYVVSGTEHMGYARAESLDAEPYDAEKDFIKLRGEGSFLVMRAGLFIVLHPQDAHMPGMAITTPAPVRKVVVKVRL